MQVYWRYFPLFMCSYYSNIGHWDSVLSQTSSFQLPKDKSVALYEQVVLELLELKEVDLAREVLKIVIYCPYCRLTPLSHIDIENDGSYDIFESD
jgi:hypothetical protein